MIFKDTNNVGKSFMAIPGRVLQTFKWRLMRYRVRKSDDEVENIA